MDRIKISMLCLVCFASVCYGADSKVSDLTENISVIDSDILYIIDDPAGTPRSQKITVVNLFDTIDSSAKLRAILTDETGTGVAVFGTSPTLVTPILGEATATSLSVGDGTNDLLISSGGVITMSGTAKRDLTLRPDLDFTKVTALGIPSQITYGAYTGFSLPTYSPNEELFFNQNVPGRWDGASNLTLHLLVALADEELPDEVGVAGTHQSFNLQVSWANSELGEPLLNTTTDVSSQTIILAGRTDAYDTYELTFVIDYDADAGNHILHHDDFVVRLRRIDVVAAEEADCEIIILDWHVHYQVDKMFKAPD